MVFSKDLVKSKFNKIDKLVIILCFCLILLSDTECRKYITRQIIRCNPDIEPGYKKCNNLIT